MQIDVLLVIAKWTNNQRFIIHLVSGTLKHIREYMAFESNNIVIILFFTYFYLFIFISCLYFYK